MKTLITLLTFGTFLASTAAALATSSPATPVHHHKKADWTLVSFVDPSAGPTAGARAKARERLLRHEGLSRNARDCVKYGCVGF